MLVPILSVARDELEGRLRTGKPFVWLKRGIDLSEAKGINDMNGVGILKEGKRFYPHPHLASHLIGFVGVDSQGLEGVELFYDSYIKGSPRVFRGERDGRGGEMVLVDMEKNSPSRGMDVVLTIDKTIQYITEKELQKAVSTTKAKGGLAIVMDPRTGEILAMTNAPSFDPSAFWKYKPSIWRNRAITDSFEPGSVFKVFLLAAALVEGMVNPKSLFFCENGIYKVADRTFHDVKRFGWLTLPQVIKYSSNIGAAKMGERLGKRGLYRYIREFGFGAKTGIDMPGEAVGSIHPPDEWSAVSIDTISFGQGLSVTGIQLVTAMSAVANGGYLMKPFVVKKILGKDGKAVKDFNPEVRRRVIPEETAKKVTAILKEVTREGGTGVKAAIDGFEVAGKTGTAQKPDLLTGGYKEGGYISSFLGFVPADAPRLTILVLLDEPEGEFYGGAIAAPVFKDIAVQVLPYLGVFPEGLDRPPLNYMAKISTEEATGEGERYEDNTSSLTPDFSGKTIRYVLRMAREIPMEVKVIGSGRAIAQRPRPGERIAPGSEGEVVFQ
ncbi:MAG: penicillin-binding protein [Deltaproteobacteria bacterium]|nr:penicillin-binding protein [Deltaproteobacteria bacterium]